MENLYLLIGGAYDIPFDYVFIFVLPSYIIVRRSHPNLFLCFLCFSSTTQNDGMLKVRPGPQRKAAGFQAQIVCLTPWTNGTHPGQITALCINSNYGL